MSGVKNALFGVIFKEGVTPLPVDYIVITFFAEVSGKVWISCFVQNPEYSNLKNIGRFKFTCVIFNAN